jgi:hypothetical protein
VCRLLQVGLGWLPSPHSQLRCWRPPPSKRQYCGQVLLCHRLPLADSECQNLISLLSIETMQFNIAHDNCLPQCVHQWPWLNS